MSYSKPWVNKIEVYIMIIWVFFSWILKTIIIKTYYGFLLEGQKKTNETHLFDQQPSSHSKTNYPTLASVVRDNFTCLTKFLS